MTKKIKKRKEYGFKKLYAIEDEKNNALWISTFSGISRFDLETKTFYNYSLDDGLQGLMYSEIAQIKTSGGLIMFGGNNGITWFHPDSIGQTSKPPIVSFTNILVDNNGAYIRNAVDDDNRMEFQMVLL